MGREQIKVELVDHMGSDLSTVNSARVSFDKESDWLDSLEGEALQAIKNTLSDIAGRNDWFTVKQTKGVLAEGDVKLIKYLAKHKHMTPFRHNQIQIRCNAPIFIARQLGKHQAGLSWNEVSRRYVDSEPEFFVPDEWRGRPNGSIKQGSGGVVEHLEGWSSIVGVSSQWDMSTNIAYDHFINVVEDMYREFLESGVAPEMARMILPQSMMTSWYWTGNLISFAHVYKERIGKGAQLEAQWFAEDLDKVIRPLFPESWSALVD